jgi:hypothetical protein
VKLFRRSTTQGYGNIYTPHAGSMIIQVQREHGLANRTIVLTPGQVRLLKSFASRKWIVVAFVFLATWSWLVVDRAQEVLARRGNSAVTQRARVDSLARQLHELQDRYDQVSRMLGAGTATPAAAMEPAPTPIIEASVAP